MEHGFAERSHCPCCEAPAAGAARRAASAPPAESMPAEAHGSFLSGYGARRLFFTYVACPRCGAAYCPTYYSQEQLDRLYARQAENMADVPLAARLRTQERYARLLLGYSRRGGDYLEIGADNGSFAARCAQAGGFERFWLYEPNREVHGAIGERLSGRRFEIRTGRFTGQGEPGAGKVSTAVMIHVLDHLLDPLAMLRALGAALEPGGVLLIVTHDAASLLARALGRRWPPFTLQHPQLYTPAALRALLGRAGFETRRVAKTVNDFPFFFLARAACEVFGLPRIVPASLQGPLVGLRLGNIAAIAVKRP
jgi:hypothetical protein